MFLCEVCYPKYSGIDFMAEMGPGSYGPCESCKKIASCLDVHVFKKKKVKNKKKVTGSIPVRST